VGLGGGGCERSNRAVTEKNGVGKFRTGAFGKLFFCWLSKGEKPGTGTGSEKQTGATHRGKGKRGGGSGGKARGKSSQGGFCFWRGGRQKK